MDNETPIKKRKLETTTMEATTTSEIFVVPFFGQGHLFPAMELCKNISTHNYKVTLIIPSHLSSSIPSTFSNHSPLIHVAEISVAPSSPPDPVDQPGPETHGHHRKNPLQDQNLQLGKGIKSFLSAKSGSRPTCVVIDVMMSWSKDIFVNYQIPVVSFSTSGATASAMGYGMWKSEIGDLKPGQIREIPGLPKEMFVSYSDLNRGQRGGRRGERPNRPRPPGDDHPHPHPKPMNRNRFGPPNGPGQKPRWVDEVEGSVALLINTCENLERVFIDYMSEQTKLPVWGIGPLLPEQFWKSAGEILHDHEMRSSSNHKSNYTEDEVIQWLETKPRGSVIYISFGSEVGPSIEEYKELAKALEESDQCFIWVIQPGSGKTGIPRSFLGQQQTDDSEEEEGYYPEGLDVAVGDRGLIITGWAPQLLILSHPSTVGFLSHCGWNSTVEAIGRGVPILGWPIRGDQFDNAKLVANYLKVGHVMSRGGDGDELGKGKFKKDDIAAGIERLMSDEKVHRQVKELGKEFESGFPVSSVKALGAFVEFVSQKET